MSVNSFAELFEHYGHDVHIVTYGPTIAGVGKTALVDTQNVAIECEDCHEVLLDFDKPPQLPKRVEVFDSSFAPFGTYGSIWVAEEVARNEGYKYLAWNDVVYEVGKLGGLNEGDRVCLVSDL